MLEQIRDQNAAMIEALNHFNARLAAIEKEAEKPTARTAPAPDARPRDAYGFPTPDPARQRYANIPTTYVDEDARTSRPATRPQAPAARTQTRPRPQNGREIQGTGDNSTGSGPASAPRTGSQMFRWAADHNEINAVMAIGRERGFPDRIVNWSPEQVNTAYEDLMSDDAGPDIHPDDEKDRGEYRREAYGEGPSY